MRQLLGLRSAARVLAAGIAPTVCIGALLLNPPAMVRLDSRPLATSATHRSQYPQNRNSGIPSHMVRHVASGSLAGMATGLIVAMFSRTLVFLTGIFVASLQVASRFGLDIPQLASINRRLLGQSSRLIGGADNPWFTTSFALTFLLAAFVHL